MSKQTHVRGYVRSKPIRRLEDDLLYQAINAAVHAECVAAVESELSKILPDLGRDDLDRIRETY